MRNEAAVLLPRKVDDIMMGFGYRIFRIYEQVSEWISDLPVLRRSNFVYMSERFASANPYRLTREIYEKDRIIERLTVQLESFTGKQ